MTSEERRSDLKRKCDTLDNLCDRLELNERTGLWKIAGSITEAERQALKIARMSLWMDANRIED